MSVEDLRADGQLCVDNPTHLRRAKEIGLHDIRGQAAYAKTLGLQFDDRDLETLARGLQPTGELSEDELASVAGGVVLTESAVAVAVGVSACTPHPTGVSSSTAAATAGGW